jgi:hypothetical protein
MLYARTNSRFLRHRCVRLGPDPRQSLVHLLAVARTRGAPIHGCAESTGGRQPTGHGRWAVLSSELWSCRLLITVSAGSYLNNELSEFIDSLRSVDEAHRVLPDGTTRTCVVVICARALTLQAKQHAFLAVPANAKWVVRGPDLVRVQGRTQLSTANREAFGVLRVLQLECATDQIRDITAAVVTAPRADPIRNRR